MNACLSVGMASLGNPSTVKEREACFTSSWSLCIQGVHQSWIGFRCRRWLLVGCLGHGRLWHVGAQFFSCCGDVRFSRLLVSHLLSKPYCVALLLRAEAVHRLCLGCLSGLMYD